MALEAGALDGNDNFINPDCMAKYMEDAMPPPADPNDTGKRGRRLFLIAISTGVINYMKEHDDDSFLVHLPSSVTSLTGTLEIL